MDGGFGVDGDGFGAEAGGCEGAAGESVDDGDDAEAHGELQWNFVRGNIWRGSPMRRGIK